MKYSKHAMKRSQQRAIPKGVMELLLSYGEAQSAGQGASIFTFRSKQTKRELERECEILGVTDISKYWDTYIVFIENTVITAGHRYKRVKSRFDERRKGKTKVVH